MQKFTDSLDKVQVVFKQLYRDWTAHGVFEREQTYRPILNEIEFYYPNDIYVRSEINILVPGSGLGRLPYEIALRGFHCEGNEFNGFLLIMSNFVINCCVTRNQYEVIILNFFLKTFGSLIFEYISDLSVDFRKHEQLYNKRSNGQMQVPRYRTGYTSRLPK